MPAKHLGSGLQGELHLLVRGHSSLLQGGRSLFLRGKLPRAKLRRALPIWVLWRRLPPRSSQCLLLLSFITLSLRSCKGLYLPPWPALWN